MDTQIVLHKMTSCSWWKCWPCLLSPDRNTAKRMLFLLDCSYLKLEIVCSATASGLFRCVSSFPTPPSCQTARMSEFRRELSREQSLTFCCWCYCTTYWWNDTTLPRRSWANILKCFCCICCMCWWVKSIVGRNPYKIYIFFLFWNHWNTVLKRGLQSQYQNN